MKTGIAIPDEPSQNVQTFILAFMAIIWRRVWITTSIYCDHNKLKISSDVILKCLKYNIFSKAGIGNNIKPYVIKALNDGFLMPQFYKQNLYATRAVKLFKTAYEIVKSDDRDKDMEFIRKYALSVFGTSDDKVNEVMNETADVMKDISHPDDDISDNTSDSYGTDTSDSNIADNPNDEVTGFSKFMDTGERCTCKMCELVDSWDVNVDLIYSTDPFENVVMKGLMSTLNDTNV